MKVNNYIAIILSAGKGVRLGTKYKNYAKVLIPIYNGKTSLDYNLKILSDLGVKKKIVNSHLHFKKINNFIKTKYKNDTNIKIIKEKKLLGTAQTVLRASKTFKEFDNIIVLYGDNISKINLKKVIKNYNYRKYNFCIVSNYIKDSGNSGVIKINKFDELISFEEKKYKYKNKPNWVNSGIYIISKKIVKMIGKKKDFGLEFIPHLIRKKIKIQVLKTRNKIFTIDNPKLLKKTRDEIKF